MFVLLEMDGSRLFACNDDLFSFKREMCGDFFGAVLDFWRQKGGVDFDGITLLSNGKMRMLFAFKPRTAF